MSSLKYPSPIFMHLIFSPLFKCEWKYVCINLNLLALIVATLALGSWPRQRLARVRAKRETWECRRVWGNEPSHSQMNSHFGSWSLGGFPNLQRAISGGQNSLDCVVPYINGKLLERRCLKWAHITHLDT